MPMTDHDPSIAALTEAINGLSRKVDRLDVSIRGDGKAEPGLVSRLSAVERAEAARTRHIFVLWTGFVGAVVSVVVAKFMGGQP